MVETKRLLKQTDIVSVGDLLMFRDRFKKNNYALFKVDTVCENNESIYAECVSVTNFKHYKVGLTVYFSKSAHTIDQRRETALTYILPVGNLLYGGIK